MLVTLAQVGPAQQGLGVDSIQALEEGLTRDLVEAPIPGQEEERTQGLEVERTQDQGVVLILGLGEALTQGRGVVLTQGLEVERTQDQGVGAIAVLAGVIPTSGIDPTQIAGEI